MLNSIYLTDERQSMKDNNPLSINDNHDSVDLLILLQIVLK